MAESPRDQAEKGWVAGKVREAADGLRGRQEGIPAAQEARLREAAERERKAQPPQQRRKK